VAGELLCAGRGLGDRHRSGGRAAHHGPLHFGYYLNCLLLNLLDKLFPLVALILTHTHDDVGFPKLLIAALQEVTDQRDEGGPEYDYQANENLDFYCAHGNTLSKIVGVGSSQANRTRDSDAPGTLARLRASIRISRVGRFT
jgi:hypothetical protein